MFREGNLTLEGGRQLAYAEYGDPHGQPIIVMHGLPGSRLSWGLLPGEPFPPGLRVIAPDRPGYGRSDPHYGRSLLDWSKDIESLADELELHKFSVLGVSGGGPGTLACAWRFPDRLLTVGVVSGPAPTDAPGVFKGLSKLNRFFLKLARRAPWLSNLNLRMLAKVIRRNPARYINTLKYKLHEVDRQTLEQPEVEQMLIKDFTEALSAGPYGMIDDMNANHGEPWGFDLADIKCPIKLWYCNLDRSVSPAMGEYLASKIPKCEARFIPEAGHLWVLTHMREILECLVISVDQKEFQRD